MKKELATIAKEKIDEMMKDFTVIWLVIYEHHHGNDHDTHYLGAFHDKKRAQELVSYISNRIGDDPGKHVFLIPTHLEVKD